VAFAIVRAGPGADQNANDADFFSTKHNQFSQSLSLVTARPRCMQLSPRARNTHLHFDFLRCRCGLWRCWALSDSGLESTTVPNRSADSEQQTMVSPNNHCQPIISTSLAPTTPIDLRWWRTYCSLIRLTESIYGVKCQVPNKVRMPSGAKFNFLAAIALMAALLQLPLVAGLRSCMSPNGHETDNAGPAHEVSPLSARAVSSLPPSGSPVEQPLFDTTERSLQPHPAGAFGMTIEPHSHVSSEASFTDRLSGQSELAYEPPHGVAEALASSAADAHHSTTDNVAHPQTTGEQASAKEHVPAMHQDSTEYIECESLQLVRLVVVAGLLSVMDTDAPPAAAASASVPRHTSSKQAHHPNFPWGDNAAASRRQPDAHVMFKGFTVSTLSPFPRRGQTGGHDWAFRDVRLCILSALDTLPEAARPCCHRRHVWRAGFTQFLKAFCERDHAVQAAAAELEWQCQPKGTSHLHAFTLLVKGWGGEKNLASPSCFKRTRSHRCLRTGFCRGRAYLELKRKRRDHMLSRNTAVPRRSDTDALSEASGTSGNQQHEQHAVPQTQLAPTDVHDPPSITSPSALVDFSIFEPYSPSRSMGDAESRSTQLRELHES
jgi:hypothetical protein